MAAPNPTLKLAVVFEGVDSVALSIAEAALEEAGIEFAVQEDAHQGFGFSPMVNPVSRIEVAEEDEGRALELLSALSEPFDPLTEEEAASE